MSAIWWRAAKWPKCIAAGSKSSMEQRLCTRHELGTSWSVEGSCHLFGSTFTSVAHWCTLKTWSASRRSKIWMTFEFGFQHIDMLVWELGLDSAKTCGFSNLPQLSSKRFSKSECLITYLLVAQLRTSAHCSGCTALFLWSPSQDHASFIFVPWDYHRASHESPYFQVFKTYPRQEIQT